MAGRGIVQVFNGTHDVFASEEQAATTDYAIHLWHQVIPTMAVRPEDHGYARESHWYNVTFVPHQTFNFVEERDSYPCLNGGVSQPANETFGPGRPEALRITGLRVRGEQQG